MKNLYRNILVIVVILTNSSFVYSNEIGIGALVGSYTAISGEYIIDKNNSYDAGLAFGFGDKKKLHIHASKLFHKPESLLFSGQTFGWYYGLGARIRTVEKKDDEEETNLGARASAGLKYDFKDYPLVAFTEFAFTFDVIPETDADGDLVIGMRYYF